MTTVRMELTLLGSQLRLPDGVKVVKAEDLSGLDDVERATASGVWLVMTPAQDEELRRNVVTSALGRMPTRKEAKLLRIKFYDEEKGLINP